MSRLQNLAERSAIDTRERFSWILFDTGDQGFATVILGVILPIYYVGPGGGSLVQFSYTLSISFAIIAVLSPILGALADYLERSKAFLAVFTAMGISATAAIFVTGEGYLPVLWWSISVPTVDLPFFDAPEVLLLSTLIAIANIGYRGERLFYNSLLPGISTEDTIDRVSAAGFAAGYVGGTIILILAFILVSVPELFGIHDAATAARMSLFVAACWWAFFAIPLFIFVPEPDRGEEDKPAGNPIRSSFSRLHNTYQEVRFFEMAFLFLVAYWFYINGVNSIILLAAGFAEDVLLIPEANIMMAFLAVQFLGIPFALAFGQIADAFSTKTALYLGLGIYICIALAAIVIETFVHFFILAVAVGMVQGGTQALSRSMFGSLIPEHKSGEFFAFFTIVGGTAAIAGPLMFGIIADFTGNERLGIASISMFFIVGMILLRRVDVEEGRSLARETLPPGMDTPESAEFSSESA